MGETVWYCAHCRCPNAPLRTACAVCGTLAPGVVPAAPSEAPAERPRPTKRKPAPLAPAASRPAERPEPPAESPPAPRSLEDVHAKPTRLLEPGRRPKIPRARRGRAASAPIDPTVPGSAEAPLPVREGPPHCPACSRPLEAAAFESITAFRCPSCDGLWFDAGTLRQVLRGPDRPPTPEERRALRARLTSDPVGTDRRSALACARCGAGMERKLPSELGPIWLDVCAAHGVWFDAGEFERYARFVAEGGLSVPPPLPSRAIRRSELLENEPSATGGILLAVLAAMFTPRRRSRW